MAPASGVSRVRGWIKSECATLAETADDHSLTFNSGKFLFQDKFCHWKCDGKKWWKGVQDASDNNLMGFTSSRKSTDSKKRGRKTVSSTTPINQSTNQSEWSSMERYFFLPTSFTALIIPALSSFPPIFRENKSNLWKSTVIYCLRTHGDEDTTR